MTEPAPLPVSIWIHTDRFQRAIKALDASLSLREWAVINPSDLPDPQHVNLGIVAQFVAEINQSILNALQKEERKAKCLVHDRPLPCLTCRWLDDHP